jgi:AmmeMemoRadiSam system protein A
MGKEGFGRWRHPPPLRRIKQGRGREDGPTPEQAYMAGSESAPVGNQDREEARAAADLSDFDRELLKSVAWQAIRHGLDTGEPLEPTLEGRPPAVVAPGAVFVTLNRRGHLRGCVGNFEARRPLIREVAQNAFSAAFMDFRFPPLSHLELPELEVHISILTPLEPLEAKTRDGLFEVLRPGLDGLLVEDPPHRATFLPQVWKSLEDPEEFLSELFRKAGLPRNHWSDTLRFHRYGVEEF